MSRETTKQNEGYRSIVYDDETGKPVVPGYTMQGHATIGWGSNLEVPISRKVADLIFEERYGEADFDILEIFPVYNQDMTPARWSALVDMRYQMGPGGFRGFHDMIAAVKEGRWSDAADECKDSEYGRDPRTKARAQANADALRNG